MIFRKCSEANPNLLPGLSFNLLALLFLAHGMPRAREFTSKFFMLSYYNPESGQYYLGSKDGYLMLFCVVLFTGLRDATMEYILTPFAKLQGIHKKKDLTRFSEQAWLLVYYCVFWPLGVVGPPSYHTFTLAQLLTRSNSTSTALPRTTLTSTNYGRRGRSAK